MVHDSIMDEVSRQIPPDLIHEYGDAALFIAYGCVLLEKENKKSYTYSAQNLKTGRTVILCRRKKQLTTSSAGEMAEKIRLSPVAGKGVLQAEMPPGENLIRDALGRILLRIFADILPQHGYVLRENQRELAAHILDAIGSRAISLSEAEVGTGKTHAYLIAAALAKRGRVNDFWLRGHYPEQSYAESAHMPVVISTSSIALQNAIVRDYIPEISRILLTHGVIKTPLSCVVRKGKEHYLCRRNLESYLADADAPTRALLAPLSRENASIDLGAAEGLTPYVRRRIGVPGRCEKACPFYESCGYLNYRKLAQSGAYDFQVCNHNYFLADVLHRASGQRPLISHYQAIVIDEAHKLADAARQMYGLELSSRTVPEITGDILNFTFQPGTDAKTVRQLALALYGQNKRLFMGFAESIRQTGDADERERFPVAMNTQTSAHFRTIRRLCGGLITALKHKPVLEKHSGRCAQLLWELERIREPTAIFAHPESLICWLERPAGAAASDAGELLLCGTPKRLGEMLCRDLWSKGIPAVLTSGTISANGDFAHIKRVAGLHLLPQSRLTETSKPSPFNYYSNTLIYISEKVPFPNSQDGQYLLAVAEEAGQLIQASHGHAALLFTSYRAMDMVFEILSQREMGFPLFRMDRGGAGVIEQFRCSGNGVLFASGAMWEGIDLPGDILSLLIIVKLPFAAPDPIGDYERTLYGSMEEYKNRVIVPEMLIKLKQGFGRLIRTETDTGVVALLDSRLREGGTYREQALAALPRCKTTSNITHIEHFFKTRKPSAYFS